MAAIKFIRGHGTLLQDVVPINTQVEYQCNSTHIHYQCNSTEYKSQ